MHYRFGDYTLDTQRYELHRAGQQVPLRPKVFHVLAHLKAQRDPVVSKDELLAQVWPGQCISEETLAARQWHMGAPTVLDTPVAAPLKSRKRSQETPDPPAIW